MAGRGVDIKLGGNPERLTQSRAAQARAAARRPGLRASASRTSCPSIEHRVEADREMVLTAGGLYIVGTERHESRRIDNQLRGRSGRQGDPGESRFFLSAEDDLVRLFAGDRIYKILDRLGTVDDEGREEPIEAGMLSKQIEKAQKKVEEQNFLQRKRVLEYDDVMNEQRRIVYNYRNEILEGKDMGDRAARRSATSSPAPSPSSRRRLHRGLGPRRHDHRARGHVPGRAHRRGPRPSTPTARSSSQAARRRDQALQRARGGARRGAHARRRALRAAAVHRPALARAPLRHGLPARGHPPARLRADRADRRVQERGVHAVRGPHGHDLVGLHADDLQPRGRGARGGGRARRRQRYEPSGTSTRPGRVSYSGGGQDSRARSRSPRPAAARRRRGVLEEYEAPPPVQQRVLSEEQTVGRNDPCWCGSGKKFKKCHGA